MQLLYGGERGRGQQGAYRGLRHPPPQTCAGLKKRLRRRDQNLSTPRYICLHMGAPRTLLLKASPAGLGLICGHGLIGIYVGISKRSLGPPLRVPVATQGSSSGGIKCKKIRHKPWRSRCRDDEAVALCCRDDELVALSRQRSHCATV